MLASPTVVYRGLVDYVTCWHEMRAYTAQRNASSPDQIWLVRHPPIYTLGQAAQISHLYGPNNTSILSTGIPCQWHGIPVLKIDRGGQVTYHGPGQVIAYLLLDLHRRKLFVREVVWLMEQALIETLAEFHVVGERHLGHPGVYLRYDPLANAKIAALGLKISRGYSYHGVALNVAMDLQPFNWINPCGQTDSRTIDLLSLGIKLDLSYVEQCLSRHLLRQFEVKRNIQEVK